MLFLQCKAFQNECCGNCKVHQCSNGYWMGKTSLERRLSPHYLGSVSAALSSPVFVPPREEREFGEEPGLRFPCSGTHYQEVLQEHRVICSRRNHWRRPLLGRSASGIARPCESHWCTMFRRKLHRRWKWDRSLFGSHRPIPTKLEGDTLFRIIGRWSRSSVHPRRHIYSRGWRLRQRHESSKDASSGFSFWAEA